MVIEAQYNCGACAFAVEQRLNGSDFTIASLENIPYDWDMEQRTGKKCVYMAPSDIADRLKAMGPGSHLIAGINRIKPNGKPASGHWFNVFFDGRDIYTLDGQSGEILPFPYDYGHVSAWCALV